MGLGTIFIALIIFGFLIIIHELGHFICAKLLKVKVEEFAIGMGPKIFGYQSKETLYTLRAIPMGGYCKMQGEDESNYVEGSFNSKSKWARIVILAAGSIMNIIGCIILLSAIYLTLGFPSTTIDVVESEYPAYEAGLLQGDTIKEIDGVPVNHWSDITDYISNENEQTYELLIERDAQIMPVQVSSQYDEELHRYRVGISPERKTQVFLSITQGFKQTAIYTQLIFSSLGQLISGNASTNDLMGPIGVVSVVGETVQYGFTALLNLAAVISINLAIFNLLPIPALDGSRIVFVIVEWIKGSPVKPEKEGMIHFVGFAILLIFAVFIAYNDILRLR
ncbi:MAG: RIP metalloprotease RseP [Eubacteriales bacterium]